MNRSAYRSRSLRLVFRGAGYREPRLQDWIRKAGHEINHKRTARIYREMGMPVKKRRRKKLGRIPKIVHPAPTRPNEVWSMDFVHDWLMTNWKLKCLTIVDDFTKECVGILVDHTISCDAVGFTHDFITPGNPNENDFIESFNSRFRDECLNEHVFRNLDDARRKIGIWRQEDYDELHPHSSLGIKSPKELAKDWEEMLSPNTAERLTVSLG